MRHFPKKQTRAYFTQAQNPYHNFESSNHSFLSPSSQSQANMPDIYQIFARQILRTLRVRRGTCGMLFLLLINRMATRQSSSQAMFRLRRFCVKVNGSILIQFSFDLISLLRAMLSSMRRPVAWLIWVVVEVVDVLRTGT